MQRWIGGWGYRVTDFSLFPLVVENETQRIIIRHNVHASKVRVEFSNLYGRHPLPITHATIARAEDDGRILPQTSRDITFDGNKEYVLAPGEVRYCDAVDFSTAPDQKLAISLYISPKTVVTGACSSQSKILTNVKNTSDGDQCLADDFEPYDQHDHFVDFLREKPLYTCFYASVEVEFLTDDDVKTVVAFGDSITQQGHWSEAFSEALYDLAPGKITVLNRGICGNRVLHDSSTRSFFGNYFGPAGLLRFEEDVFLNHDTPVDFVIAKEGINDLIQPRVFAPAYEAVTAEDLMQGINQMKEITHRHGAKFYTATYLPYRGYMENVWKREDDDIRKEINFWLRSGNHDFDGVFEFESALKDPADPDYILEAFHAGDHLHANPAGGRMMANQIPLHLFVDSNTAERGERNP